MDRLLRALLAVPFLVAVSSVARPAHANERHFTYTYESATLPAGAAEIEPWTTWRVGREDYYNRFDHRLEFEYGLTDRLQTSIYINFTAISQDDEMNMRQTTFEYAGVSSEWKYKLLDSIADPIGLALYLELTGAPDEVEFEEKIIVDKRIGNMMFAGNLVFEQEVEIGPAETEVEHILELDLAGGYFLTEHFMLGLEFRNHTIIAHGELEASAFFLGPTIAYAQQTYWIALSLMPQLAAITPDPEPAVPGGPVPPDDDIRDLDHHEMFNARLLLGFHL